RAPEFFPGEPAASAAGCGEPAASAAGCPANKREPARNDRSARARGLLRTVGEKLTESPENPLSEPAASAAGCGPGELPGVASCRVAKTRSRWLHATGSGEGVR